MHMFVSHAAFHLGHLSNSIQSDKLHRRLATSHRLSKPFDARSIAQLAHTHRTPSSNLSRSRHRCRVLATHTTTFCLRHNLANFCLFLLLTASNLLSAPLRSRQFFTMAAINALVTRDLITGQLVKRKNWAAREPGVMVVFCIVGVGTLHLACSMARPNPS